jgi:hypothetical protein
MFIQKHFVEEYDPTIGLSLFSLVFVLVNDLIVCSTTEDSYRKQVQINGRVVLMVRVSLSKL